MDVNIMSPQTYLTGRKLFKKVKLENPEIGENNGLTSGKKLPRQTSEA